MKAQYKVKPDLIIEIEAETQKELFQKLASAVEVFGERKCGRCGFEQITFAYRTVTQGKKTYEYPEYHCGDQKCGARLSLGSAMEGGSLFPIRKLIADGPEKGKPSREDGKYDSQHKGWTTYKGNKDEPKVS